MFKISLPYENCENIRVPKYVIPILLALPNSVNQLSQPIQKYQYFEEHQYYQNKSDTRQNIHTHRKIYKLNKYSKKYIFIYSMIKYNTDPSKYMILMESFDLPLNIAAKYWHLKIK